MSYCWYTEQDGYKHELRERWVKVGFWDECWPISRVPCLKVCFISCSLCMVVTRQPDSCSSSLPIQLYPLTPWERERDRKTQWDRAGLSVADQGLDNPTPHNECEQSSFDQIMSQSKTFLVNATQTPILTLRHRQHTFTPVT